MRARKVVVIGMAIKPAFCDYCKYSDTSWADGITRCKVNKAENISQNEKGLCKRFALHETFEKKGYKVEFV